MSFNITTNQHQTSHNAFSGIPESTGKLRFPSLFQDLVPAPQESYIMSDFEMMVEDSPEMLRVIDKAYEASLDVINKKMREAKVVLASQSKKRSRSLGRGKSLCSPAKRIRKRRKKSLKKMLLNQKSLKQVSRRGSISGFVESLKFKQAASPAASCHGQALCQSKRSRKTSFNSKVSTEPSVEEVAILASCQ